MQTHRRVNTNYNIKKRLSLNLRRFVRGNKMKLDNKDFELDFPKWQLDLRAQYEIENFLSDLLQYNIVKFNTKRVLVVTGAKAVASTANGYYSHPATWDTDYETIVVVYESEVKFIGKIKGLSKEGVNAGIDALITNKQHVIDVKSITDTSITVGAKKGSKGAFTQSHRYFDSLDAFSKAFV